MTDLRSELAVLLGLPDRESSEHEVIVAVASLRDHLAVMGSAVGRFHTQIEAVRALCTNRQAETNDGSMTDVDELWPSQVLAVLDAPPDVTR